LNGYDGDFVFQIIIDSNMSEEIISFMKNPTKNDDIFRFIKYTQDNNIIIDPLFYITESIAKSKSGIEKESIIEYLRAVCYIEAMDYKKTLDYGEPCFDNQKILNICSRYGIFDSEQLFETQYNKIVNDYKYFEPSILYGFKVIQVLITYIFILKINKKSHKDAKYNMVKYVEFMECNKLLQYDVMYYVALIVFCGGLNKFINTNLLSYDKICKNISSSSWDIQLIHYTSDLVFLNDDIKNRSILALTKETDLYAISKIFHVDQILYYRDGYHTVTRRFSMNNMLNMIPNKKAKDMFKNLYEMNLYNKKTIFGGISYAQIINLNMKLEKDLRNSLS